MQRVKRLHDIYSKNADLSQMIIVAALVFLAMSLILGHKFYGLTNINSMLLQLPQYGMMTLSVVLAMMLGGIDLSAVYLGNLGAVLASLYMVNKAENELSGGQTAGMIVMAVFIALIIGIAGGALNGFIIAYFKVPAMLGTLGTGQIFMGISVVLTKGHAISNLPEVYSKIGSYQILNAIPLSFVIFIAAAAAVGFIIGKTKFGKRVQLVGTNITSAYYSGIRVRRTIIKTWLIAGLMSAIGGLIMLSRNNSAKADYGSSYTLMCVMIAILGGVKDSGGYGRISAVVVAVLTVQMISSAITMNQSVNNYFTRLLWGAILIAVIIIRHAMSSNTR